MRAIVAAALAAALLVTAAAPAQQPAQTEADVALWLGDLERLKTGLARNYANFEYAILGQRLDLPALAARTEAAIRAASDDDGRRRALIRMLRNFHDPHIAVAPIAASATPPAAGEASLACDAGGAAYAENAGLPFARNADYMALDHDAARIFPAGIQRTASGRRFGIVRIPTFVDRAWALPCATAAAQLRLAPEDPCNDACGETLEPAIGRILSRSLAETLAALQQASAEAVVVDLTGNGGGGNWAEVAARILGGPLPGARLAYLRHPSWVATLEAEAGDLDAALQGARGEWRARLLHARAIVRTAIAEARESCDLSGAWTDPAYSTGGRPLPCSPLVSDMRWSTGFEPYAAPHEPIPGRAEALVYAPAKYGAWTEGATRLPVFILVDRDTYSAAELLAARLQDHGRALIVGEVTGGAGCGHAAGGGNDILLAHAGLRIELPDCARLRADGANERRGITPDVLVVWGASDSPVQRLEKMLRALDRMPLAANRRDDPIPAR